MSLKHTLLIFGILTICHGSNDAEIRSRRYEDPFATLDRHVSHALAYHYLWPWSELMKAAAALDAENNLEEPQIISDPKRYQVNLNVKRFAPEELRIKVKNRVIIVEGKHKMENDGNHFMASHFQQRFILPQASMPEEVKAVLKENGILSIFAPKHEIVTEREVPIEVEKSIPEEQPTIEDRPDNSSEESEPIKESKPLEEYKPLNESKPSEETITEKKLEEQTTILPSEQLDPVESSTHLGKIRKKELKTTTKTTKDNEVTKNVDGNGLDYALLETDE